MSASRRAAIAMALLTAACASDDGSATDTVSTASRREPTVTAAGTVLAAATSTTAPSTTDAASSTSAPSSPARRAFEEVLGWLERPDSLDPDRFSADFLATVPPEQLTAAFEELRNVWVVENVTDVSPDSLTAVIRDPLATLDVQLRIDVAGFIAELVFLPHLDDAPTSLTELSSQLAAAAPTSGLLVATVAANGTCQPIQAHNPDAVLPVASVFKLYVLGAVASAIARGEAAWDQPVELRDELDSLPSGTTQDEPAGSTLIVQELALRMIRDSDNTATDHLIELVSRPAVEAMLAELGHADPSVSLPMLTTREIFVLKTFPALLERYAVADEPTRRTILATEVAASRLPSSGDWPNPRAVATVEWFASPADICRAFVGLAELSAQPGLEPLDEVLSTNPGAPVDPARFSRLWFKAGSEPGVLFLAWLATRPDGSQLAVIGGAMDETANVAPHVGRLISLALTLAPR